MRWRVGRSTRSRDARTQSILANAFLGPSAVAVAAITVGSTLAPVCACLMLRKAPQVRWPVRARRVRWIEAVTLAAGTVSVTLLATRTTDSALLFLVSPVLIWAAFRFQLAGAAPCALVVSTLAVPAATGDLLLAAVITERDATHEEIKRVCLRFAEMVAQLEPRPESYELPPEDPPP
ncbi:hypothetical protein [Streptomyces sp. NPDC013457]|uniref:hypothetical protein n=1 Tax=Streptomyces sp. NPDC013457 TaxID=3364866 RepID=UPI0036FAAACA